MTDNHNHDRALFDDLAAAVPQADPAFRSRLETQLLAQLQRQVSEQEVETMQMISMYPRPAAQETDRPARRAPAPLTLAAALLMVVLAGSALLLMNRPSGEADLFAAAQQQTPTPAANVNCPPPAGWDQSYIVQAGETVLDIVIRYGVDAHLFLTANCLDTSGVLTVGQVVYLPGGEPGLRPSPTHTFTPAPAFTPTLVSPDAGNSLEMTATSIIIDATAQAQGIPLVTATPILFPPTIVPPAAGDLSAPSGFAPVVVAAQDIARGTAITPDLLAVTYWPLEMFQAGTSFYSTVAQAVTQYAGVDIPRFQPVQASSLLAQPPADAADGVINDGWIAVFIPQERVAASAVLARGDLVSVVATLMFVDVDTNTERPVGSDDVPATPRSVTQRVISGAEVIQLVDNSNRPGEFLLAVPPDDAATLIWLVDAQVPLTLEVFEG